MKVSIAQILALTVLAAIAARTVSFSEFCYGIVEVPFEILKGFKIIDLTGHFRGDRHSFSNFLGVLTGAVCCYLALLVTVVSATTVYGKAKDCLSRSKNER